MPARQTDEQARVLVFVDGQNVYKSCFEQFGHAHCHPLLLAREVAGSRRLVGVRYYSGLHDPRVNPLLNARLQRRHAVMRRCGVTVVERMLRYRWEWGLRQRDLPEPMKHQGQALSVTVEPHQRAREKGIDVALALDVVDLAQNDYMDVAVIVSSDTDLCEVARVVHNVTGRSRRVSVEAAVVRGGRKIVLLDHYDYTHQIDLGIFNAAKDILDYRSDLDDGLVGSFIKACRDSGRPNWSL